MTDDKFRSEKIRAYSDYVNSWTSSLSKPIEELKKPDPRQAKLDAEAMIELKGRLLLFANAKVIQCLIEFTTIRTNESLMKLFVAMREDLSTSMNKIEPADIIKMFLKS